MLTIKLLVSNVPEGTELGLIDKLRQFYPSTRIALDTHLLVIDAMVKMRFYIHSPLIHRRNGTVFFSLGQRDESPLGWSRCAKLDVAPLTALTEHLEVQGSLNWSAQEAEWREAIWLPREKKIPAHATIVPSNLER
jgi:hypothetical protein